MKLLINKCNCKILVCCHKPCSLPNDDSGLLLPIHVGASLSTFNMEIQRDDSLDGMYCDNISNKNPYYCELTALYWAWKNIKRLYPELEYIGLNHYRRFFSFDLNCLYDDVIIRPEEKIKTYQVRSNDIEKIMSNCDILLARKKVYPYSLQTDYCVSHMSEDIKTLIRVVHCLYPEYDDDMCDILLFNNRLSHYNMFIMKYGDFEQYCSWLFSILEEVEKRINITTYSPSQQRIWGYMGERLLNVWCAHQKFRTSYRNVLKFSTQASDMSSFTKMTSRVRAELSFLMIKSSPRTKQLIKEKMKMYDIE